MQGFASVEEARAHAKSTTTFDDFVILKALSNPAVGYDREIDYAWVWPREYAETLIREKVPFVEEVTN